MISCEWNLNHIFQSILEPSKGAGGSVALLFCPIVPIACFSGMGHCPILSPQVEEFFSFGSTFLSRFPVPLTSFLAQGLIFCAGGQSSVLSCSLQPLRKLREGWEEAKGEKGFFFEL